MNFRLANLTFWFLLIYTSKISVLINTTVPFHFETRRECRNFLCPSLSHILLLVVKGSLGIRWPNCTVSGICPSPPVLYISGSPWDCLFLLGELASDSGELEVPKGFLVPLEFELYRLRSHCPCRLGSIVHSWGLLQAE